MAEPPRPIPSYEAIQRWKEVLEGICPHHLRPLTGASVDGQWSCCPECTGWWRGWVDPDGRAHVVWRWQFRGQIEDTEVTFCRDEAPVGPRGDG